VTIEERAAQAGLQGKASQGDSEAGAPAPTIVILSGLLLDQKVDLASEGSAVVNKRQVKKYFVYIIASRSRTLYVGVTNDLERRVYEHKHKLISGFTAKYKITRLVHFEETEDVMSAIEREKQIKGWTRAKKVALVEAANPTWEDLAEEWGGE